MKTLDVILENDWLFFGIFMAPLWVSMADFWQFLKARKRFSISLSFLFVPLLQAGAIAFSYLMILFFSLNNWTAWVLLGSVVIYIPLNKKTDWIRGYIEDLKWIGGYGSV